MTPSPASMHVGMTLPPLPPCWPAIVDRHDGVIVEPWAERPGLLEGVWSCGGLGIGAGARLKSGKVEVEGSMGRSRRGGTGLEGDSVEPVVRSLAGGGLSRWRGAQVAGPTVRAVIAGRRRRNTMVDCHRRPSCPFSQRCRSRRRSGRLQADGRGRAWYMVRRGLLSAA